MYVSCYETPYGTGFVECSDSGVYRVHLPVWGAQKLSGEHDDPSPLSCQAAELLKLYFSGSCPSFEILTLDIESSTPFRKHVLECLRLIPYGQTVSYGELAVRSGFPGAARAVGGVMASNRLPILLPCHRVVGARGAMTGFTAPGGIDMKKCLLKIEGVEI